MLFAELEKGDRFRFDQKTPHDGIPSHVGPFTRLGRYAYKASVGSAEFQIDKLTTRVKKEPNVES